MWKMNIKDFICRFHSSNGNVSEKRTPYKKRELIEFLQIMQYFFNLFPIKWLYKNKYTNHMEIANLSGTFARFVLLPDRTLKLIGSNHQ